MFAAGDPVGERKDCGRDDEVQGEEKERVLFAQSNRDSERSNAKKSNGNDRRVARQRNRAEDRGNHAHAHEPEAGRFREEESKVVVTDERAPDTGGREREKGESRKRKKSAAWDEHEHGADRTDECGNLSCVRVLHDARRYAFAG